MQFLQQYCTTISILNSKSQYRRVMQVEANCDNEMIQLKQGLPGVVSYQRDR